MPPQSETMDHHHHHHQHDTFVRSCLPRLGQTSFENDNQSNAVLSEGAPRSVYLTPEPLTRELSDLSGSAYGASGKDPSVPGLVYSEHIPRSGAWRQAYVVSRPPPSSSSTKAFPRSPSSISASRSAAVMSSRDEAVEVVDQRSKEETPELYSLEKQRHSRIPVTVLLMDGSRHTYELMQVWIDRATDSVRDVVQAVQGGIPDNWKTAYDGIFQVRGHRFTQLIHILGMAKYDIQPHEILVAKPWSMTAKDAIGFANSAIRHLTNIQIINTDEDDKSGRRVSQPKPEGSPLVLSRVAQKRIYSPDGVLSHHNATHFLTFSPPFDSMIQTREQSNFDVISTPGSNVSSLSGANFQVSGPNFQGYLVDDLIASLMRPKSIEEQAASAFLKKRAQGTTKVEPLTTFDSASEASESSIVSHNNQAVANYGSRSRRNNVSFVMSQLNCFKTRERVAALACCPTKDDQEQSHKAGLRCCSMKDWNHPPLHAVDEEEGQSPNNYYHQTKSQTLHSSEDLWISGVDTEQSTKYVTRGRTRFLRLEI